MRAHGLTYAQTARKLLINRRTLMRYLEGRPCHPDVAEDLELLFKVPVELLGVKRQADAAHAQGPRPATVERAAMIRRLVAEGKTQIEIGRMLGVTRQRVSQYLRQAR